MKTIKRWIGGEPIKSPLVQLIILFATIVLLLVLNVRGVLTNAANLTFLDGIWHEDVTRLAAASDQLELLAPNDIGKRTPDWLAYSYFRQGRFDEAVAQYELAEADGEPHAIFRPNTSEYYLINGMIAAQRQDWQTALADYRYGLALNPQPWHLDIYVRYYEALLQGGSPTEVAVAQEMLRALSGEEFSAENGVTIKIAPSDLCTNITGFAYSPPAVAAGPVVPVTVYYQDGTHSGHLVLNLAPNSGFEWDKQHDQIVGYEKSIYWQDVIADTHAIVRATTPYNSDTSVASLVNTTQSDWASYQSYPVHVDEDGLYFLGGWLQDNSSSRASALGIGWYGRGEPIENPYTFVLPEIVRTWQFVGDIVAIPAVQTVDVVLIKQGAELDTTTHLDDLFFFKIDPTTCTATDI